MFDDVHCPLKQTEVFFTDTGSEPIDFALFLAVPFHLTNTCIAQNDLNENNCKYVYSGRPKKNPFLYINVCIFKS
jgi:hypothetical protein